MAIFKSKQNKFEDDLKIKLCGKRLYPTESVKYLGVKTDKNLNLQYHVNDLSIKLNRTNAHLFKIRKYISLTIHLFCYFSLLLILLLSYLDSELEHDSTNYNFTKKGY